LDDDNSDESDEAVDGDKPNKENELGFVERKNVDRNLIDSDDNAEDNWSNEENASELMVSK
jgi:hypothetical protein